MGGLVVAGQLMEAKVQTFRDIAEATVGTSDGYCDDVSATSVEGWAYNQSAPSEPLIMQVLIDGNHVGLIKCDLIRYAFGGEGYPVQKVGFYVAIPADLQDDGDHVIEFRRSDGSPITLRDPLGDHQSWILPKPTRACPREPQSTVILGNLDPVREHEVCGWAYDKSHPNVPVVLDTFIDSVFQSAVVCDIERVDVAMAGHPASMVGFRTEVPAQYFDGRWHVLEVRTQQDDQRRFKTGQGEGAAREAFNFPAQIIVGQVDGLRDGAVRGWVFAHERSTGTRSGGLQVLVTTQGHPIAQMTARDFRADVATAHGCDPTCGFSFFPPSKLVAGRTVELHFQVIPGGHTLTGSPVRVAFPSFETTADIRDLQEATDNIFAELWLLRNRLRRMVPGETYTVENYDPWARQYQKVLAAAPDLLEGLLPADGSPPPLVSIICPVYRPRLQDFVAAVNSVRAQSYANWELIIVDDASGLPELTACFKAFAEEDTRIKALILTSNSGISGATNAAIAHARGSYIALFDHDDLLAERAIEFMLAAALRTGAQMLYSDEDKIDDEGVFSEVNFKPDWNYRLLLAQNYVCHLLIVERAQLEKVGPFRSECDGAQDHDIILRLSEVIPHDKILHVPEVLYHWRKTPTSTAASGKSKTYTVAAGIRAIQDHLDRKGIAGRVHSPREITCFDIKWKIREEPAVTIIIPYREHISMTRACLEALWANTDYANYEIVLIDNWSTSDEALAFLAEMRTRRGVSVIRIEETFNYSRLNNLAVARSCGELILFMNNDVFVSHSEWLHAMVGEMLADPHVGIVGNKLRYPSGLVQHGGVILGVGGIADHAHKGLTVDDPGYVARAISAQDMSAVTAACMLCRRTTFDAVGGFDEHDLQVAFNDVDLCLKVGRAGFRVIWTPASTAEHRESISRGADMRPDQQSRFFHENETMMTRWKGVLAKDRFYHRAFSRQTGIFTDLGAPSIMDISSLQSSYKNLDRSPTRAVRQANSSSKKLRERRLSHASISLDR
jgi:GT2 family glycosyltransferase